MNFVFFGSSEFSKAVLEHLLASGRIPSCVVTASDAPKGRGLALSSSPVKELALLHNIGVMTPVDLRDPDFVRMLSITEPHLFVIVSYGKILPPRILSIPSLMPLGIHPSLLPRYRGAAPVNWALINGEERTGVSIFKVGAVFDSGQILMQEEIPIKDDDTVMTLGERLQEKSSTMIISAFDILKKGTYALTPQDSRRATYAPKLTKGDGKIHWATSARHIFNLIRGLAGWPGAFTFYKGKPLKIIEASCEEDAAQEPASTVTRIEHDAFYVACAPGILKVSRVQPAGKSVMTVEAFLCGHSLRAGDRLG